MKNKNLILFIIVGFIVTTAIWGFVGGCGTSHVTWRSKPVVITEEDKSAEGIILEEKTQGADSTLKGDYIVEQGDTLWGISKKFGVSVSSIKEANKLQTDTISVGHRLVIPGVKKEMDKVTESTQEAKGTQISPKIESKKEVQKEQATPKPGLIVYKVRKDDSLWRIAQVYGTTIERIAELNGLPKNAKLVPGQEILVPSDADIPR